MSRERVHPHFHRQERTDPMTGHTLGDTAGRPWVQEGDADDGLRIYFDSDESRQDYEAIVMEWPERDLRRTLSNDFDEGYDEG